jgi:hypothetical protein
VLGTEFENASERLKYEELHPKEVFVREFYNLKKL